MKSHVKF